MAKGNDRPVAVFHWKTYRGHASFIGKVRAIIKQIEDHPLLYPFPRPTVAVMKANLTALANAQAKAGTRQVGTASARNVKYDKVRKNVLTLLGYIQELADENNVERAIAIITNSGFSVKHKAPRIKVPFTVKHGRTSGEVRLIAEAAAKRASYNWQMSMDGVRWTDLPITIKANTVVSGLPEGKKVFFRYSSITKKGVSGWSNVVHIIVL